MKKSLKKIAKIFAILGLFTVLNSPNSASAHAFQVGYCQLNNGYIRIFVEHWHGNLSSPGQAGTMSITTTYGTSTVTQNLTPTGIINNRAWNNLSGCGSSISIISKCSGANTYNDWVYFDFAPAACDVPVKIRLNAGNTVYLVENCSTLYPATVTATFNDNAAPILTCKDVIVQSCAARRVHFKVTAVDACDPNPTVTYSHNPGSVFPLGTTNVTAYAKDKTGHKSKCTFRVIVRDAIPPTISCVSGSAIASRRCNYVIQGTQYDPTTADNCAVYKVRNNYNGGSSLNGATFPIGTTYVTWTVYDKAGNKATCVSRIIVRDVTPPKLTCPADIVLQACAGTRVNYRATAHDDCDRYPRITYSPRPGSVFPLGTTIVYVTATDRYGNRSSCKFRVTLRDAIKPVIKCTPRVVAADPGKCSYTANRNELDPKYYDNCKVARVTNSQNGRPTLAGVTFPVGSTTVKWSVWDNAGNYSSCKSTVTVVDMYNVSKS
jgi:hypothetical protein